MLVLSRKLNESIVIRDNIVVMVIEIRGDKVRLGIEAPKEVPVHRREVYDKIKGREGTKEVPQDDASGGKQSPFGLGSGEKAAGGG